MAFILEFDWGAFGHWVYPCWFSIFVLLFFLLLSILGEWARRFMVYIERAHGLQLQSRDL